MKNIGIIAALLGGFYLVTKKGTIKKHVTAIGSNNIVGVIKEDFHGMIRPPQKNPSSVPGTNPNVSSGDYSEVPSPTGGTLTIEGGTLDLAADLTGYKAYDNGIVRIPRVPQYIGSLDGKIIVTEFSNVYVVIDGFSYRTIVPNSVEKWGKLHPEDAIPVRNVPMWFKDKYPQKGIFIQDFTKPLLT